MLKGPYGYGAYGQHPSGPYGSYFHHAPQQMKLEESGSEPLEKRRFRMNICMIAIVLFVPWVLFTLLMADVSFYYFHYKFPDICWLLVGLAVVGVAAIGIPAVRNVWLLHKGDTSYRNVWVTFLFLTCVVAVVVGPTVGSSNFSENTQPYYSLQSLNDYSEVDPTRMRGQQLMDAGRVQFVPGASLDLARAYAFQNLETYCVAPISVKNDQLGTLTPLASYDFWAVGINCCDGNASTGANFKCGSYSSPTAREGLRLMKDDMRPFFRLAVQQAEAAHMIRSAHPLFFHWTDDAIADEHAYLANSYRQFAIAMCVFFALQLILVLVMTCIISKTGRRHL